MKRIIIRILIGLAVGAVLTAIAGNGQTMQVESMVVLSLWGIGSVYAFDFHVSILLRMLNPGLKLSVISFLTFRNGFMGSVPILIYIIYCLMLGWLYGLVRLIVDVAKTLL